MSFLTEFKTALNERNNSVKEAVVSEETIQKLLAPSFVSVYEDLKKTGHTHYWLKGGRGSTKSSFISIQIILGIMGDENANCVALRKVGQTLKDSVYEQLSWAISALGVENLWHGKVSPLELIYLPTGQRIIFRGADKPKKIKSTKFRKGYCKYLWYEEVDEFGGMSEIRTINQSLMRGGKDFYAFYSYNPPKSQRNWVNEEMQKPADNRMVHHSTYLKVPREWLGETFFIDAEGLKKTNPDIYEHEYLGEVTGTGGEVFNNLDIRKITDDEINSFDKILQGIDWGFYPDPYHFGRMYFDTKKRVLYIFGEYRDWRKGNKATHDKLVSLFPDVYQYNTIADSAEPKSIDDYYSYGMHRIWKVNKASIAGKGSVEYSIKWLASLSKIIIDPARCPYTAKEFNSFEHMQNSNGEYIEGYPDRDNHSIDCCRYATSVIWRERGK